MPSNCKINISRNLLKQVAVIIKCDWKYRYVWLQACWFNTKMWLLFICKCLYVVFYLCVSLCMHGISVFLTCWLLICFSSMFPSMSLFSLPICTYFFLHLIFFFLFLSRSFVPLFSLSISCYLFSSFFHFFLSYFSYSISRSVPRANPIKLFTP